MNETASSIAIAAPAEAIFALAAATDRWPLILPHYRYVRVRERRPAGAIVEMAAWCDVFPVRWIAEQTNDAARPHIAFHHLAGPARGMDVEWRFEPEAGLTRVTIVHRLTLDSPLTGSAPGRWIVGGYVVARVAGRTLARIKTLAESVAGG